MNDDKLAELCDWMGDLIKKMETDFPFLQTQEPTQPINNVNPPDSK